MFVCKAEQQYQKHTLQTASQTWSETRPNQEAQSSTWVSHVSGRGSTTWAFCPSGKHSEKAGSEAEYAELNQALQSGHPQQ